MHWVVYFFHFSQRLLHVSAGQCHPQGAQSLPEDGIVLPKHVGADVRSERSVQLSAFVGLSFTKAIFTYEIYFLELFNNHTNLNKHYVL
jgi:hypothetical protein